MVEPQIIDALYRASQAGVKIDLIVRGICSLQTRHSRSLRQHSRSFDHVGRFLEHSRVYYFVNGKDDELFCSSADWMERNFFRRTEACFPITKKSIKKRIVEDLELFLADNVQAWELQANGRYVRIDRGERRACIGPDRVAATLRRLVLSNIRWHLAEV